jgi:murein DD-endopeptidase MepM/ murein hydrolase activator NlpD
MLLAMATLSCHVWAQDTESIHSNPEDLMNGSPCLFTIQVSDPSSLVSGTLQGHKLTFFRTEQDSKRWYAIAGIDVAAKPGDYELSVTINRQGNLKTLHRRINVTAAPYIEIPLTVPEKFVQPDAQAQKIIAADQEIKRKAFSNSAPAPLWNGNFASPLQTAPSTDSFGTRRVFNGSLASVHRGLDYRAKMGTPVRAANAGRVILARPLYFEGNCIVIDHGLGLMTLYMHLSKFNVRTGQQVKRGQLIARSGRTGRATGPHLHFSVRWQGEYLDPAKLFLIALPNPD